MTRLFLAVNIVVLQAAPDYARHVAPIFQRHCVPCHRAGQVGTFALDTYASARTHARTIAAVTKSRYMPPWKASHLLGAELAGDRRLTAAEISTLNSWALTEH